MSPHIFNSLKCISRSIVAPGSRSAQYKLHNQLTNDPNNSYYCNLTTNQQTTTTRKPMVQEQIKSREEPEDKAAMPLLGRHRREASSPSASGEHQRHQQHQQQQVPTPGQGEPVCQSPMFGVRRQINLSKCDQQQSCSSSIKSSRSSPSLASSSISNKQRNQQQQQATNQCQELPQQISSQQIHYAFALMDSNGDGMIDLRDLSQMLANLGVPIDESVLSYIITSVSRRGDHRISESEFLDWLGQFVRVTAAQDERPASADCLVGARRSQATQSGRFRSGRARFRLAGGSSGSSLVAKPSNELPENFDRVTGRRRGSVGSGLALMRSLSGSSLNQDSSASSPGDTHKESQVAQQAPEQKQQQQQQAGTDELEIRQDLRAAFCVFDLDGDGYITFDEVRAGLRLLGEAWTTAEMSRLFQSGLSKRNSPASTQATSTTDLSQQRISIDDFVRLLL